MTAGAWPPTLAHRRWRYATFFSAYLYQGLVAGFSLTALANTYAGRGVSASEVGFHFALAGIPWTVQPFLWGPLIDRVGPGRRRALAVLAILGGDLALSGLLFLPGIEALALVGAVFFLHSLFGSLLDTVADRLIMDHVPAAELGRMSACTRIGFVVGTSLSGALFAWTLAAWDLRASVTLLLGLCLMATVLPVMVRETAGEPLLGWSRTLPEAAPRLHRSFRRFLLRLASRFRRPAALRWLLLCFGIDFVLALFEVRFNVALVRDQGWDPVALSHLQAGLALVSGTVGALAIGIWSDKAEPWQALAWLLAGGAAAFGLASLLLATGQQAGSLVLGLVTVIPSLFVVAMVPALMRFSSRRAGAATEFETYMAVMNLGSVSGAWLSGLIAPVVPLGAVGLAVVAVLLAGFWLVRNPPCLTDIHPRPGAIDAAKPETHSAAAIARSK